MNVTVNVDTSNGVANITVADPSTGHFVLANGLKLGSTAHMTVHQADTHARGIARQALQAAAAAI